MRLESVSVPDDGHEEKREGLGSLAQRPLYQAERTVRTSAQWLPTSFRPHRTGFDPRVGTYFAQHSMPQRLRPDD
jgi:hypothetical protein